MTCVLFGDAAGAVVLGPVEDGFGIISDFLAADGTNCDCITVPCCHVSEAESAKRQN